MASPLRGIIQDVQVPNDTIDFFSFEPPQRSREVFYDDVPIRGRSEPHVFYSHTGAQVWSLSITLFASVDQNDEGQAIDVVEKVNFLESLEMPDYGQSPGEFAVVRSPHLARIKILKMFDVIGTIRNFNAIYEGPYDIDTGYPQRAIVSFILQTQRTINQQPLGFSDIRRLVSRGQTRQT